mgnify:CR=1 FL=1
MTSPKVLQVSDGDTVVLSSSDGFEVRSRLVGIDCPEVPHKERRRGRKAKPGQPLGEEAKKRLGELLQAPFTVNAFGNDAYGRSLVELRLADGKVVNQLLVEEGFCEVYRKGNRNKKGFKLSIYEEAEQRAKSAKKGIWGLKHYEPPDVYRRRYRD